MKHCYSRFCLLLVLLAATLAAQAQIEPAAQYTTLTPAQLMAWTSTGPTAVPANVSTVPLATRQNSLAPQLNPNQSFSSKVNWCPDGMNNFVGYLNEQPQFNLYNFTHWQYIDVLTWFASPIGIPCRPWVEAAHRNGVKIIGTIFTDAAGFVALTQKDAAGNYIGAQKLVDVANYYGFDGWFFNEESRLSAAQAAELINLLKQLQAIRPAGMEIHWYDSMLPSGVVSYQNTLNSSNAPLLQSGADRVSDAIFTNYFWSGPTAINTAVTTAASIGRSPFDVYSGADIWPGRNPQQLFNSTTWLSNYYTGGSPATPRTSLAVFAPNLTFNGGLNNFNSNPADYQNFYNTEVRLFSGDDLDITTADATGWQGFGYYQPVRCAITSLPFETNFCVGQGKIFANNGAVAVKGWTDMAKQAILPSWQWARTGAATVSVGFDFSRAWYGGTSVKLAGSLAAGASTTVKLYQTKLPITATTNLDLTYKGLAAGASSTRLALYFSDNLITPEYVNVPALADTLWASTTVPLAAYANRELAIIGVQATSATALTAYRFNLGKLKLYNGTSAAVAPVANFAATATTVLTGQPVTFANSSTNATSYTWALPGATPASSTAVHATATYATAGTYAVTLTASNATGQNVLTRPAYITVLTAPAAGSNTSLSFDGLSKYVDAGIINMSGAAFSLECWVKPNSFKATSPYISSLMGMEDGGVNTLMLRLGDAGIDASQVQFVAQIGGSTRKLASVARLTAGQWTHLAGTYDGTTMRLYVNGVLDNSQAASGSLTANAPFTLGRNYAASRGLDGRLDEVRAWTRALTATEVAANACGVPTNSAALAAYWKCNDSPNLTAADASGHAHPGTLTNMAASDWSLDVPAQCATATATRSAAATGLQVQVFGNPVPGGRAEIEIQGAQNQPITLEVSNALGAIVWRQTVAASATSRLSVPLPGAAGVYLLRASTASGTATVKLLKP
ncbi:T9SS type A sorting domain-containing protein [Microvirga sp. STS02]|uniref:endo-beta-N-acetylglucosaminidase n=1 Tax=Hymenobacter negativus TaxID=2795026 RepID=UPI0018DCEB24|nr:MULTISPECIES: LamG-like jellyroll fold domain-containing protein [Bacteria]MBH8569679.1 T9SS type A sorting domain-containing protein [Hymenobacter negativus]MBR7209415.1 T9SS type A sorting domain-containing protein [Microvirga sp. STS02]